MSRFVIDTHALLFYMGHSPNLGSATEAALDDPQSVLVLPAIALAEALWIVSSRNVGVTANQILESVDSDPRITVAALTRDIVAAAHALQGSLEMHDRQIVATAVLLDTVNDPVTLLTKDAVIVASKLVRTDW